MGMRSCFHVFMSYGGVIMKMSWTDGEVSTLELLLLYLIPFWGARTPIHCIYKTTVQPESFFFFCHATGQTREHVVVSWSLQVSISCVFVLPTYVALSPKLRLVYFRAMKEHTMGRGSLTDLEDLSLVQSRAFEIQWTAARMCEVIKDLWSQESLKHWLVRLIHKT